MNGSYGHHGLAVGDVNGDGLEDLFLCQPGGLPDRLFVQNADGTATDISREARIDCLGPTKSALLLDLDNDGDQDLLVATSGHILAMANDGKGHFEERGVTTAPAVTSLAESAHFLHP